MAGNGRFHGINRAWKSFVCQTTIGGFNQAKDADNIASRIMWLILFLLGSVITVLGLYQTVDRYLQYNAVTTVTVERTSFLEFPAVSICNMNRIHCGNLHQLALECQEKSCPRYDLYCTLFVMTGCGVSLTDKDYFTFGKKMWQRVCEKFVNSSDPKDKPFNIEQKEPEINEALLLQSYTLLNLEEIKRIAHTPHKMIRKCSFRSNAMDAGCQSLQQKGGNELLWTPAAGLCYTFNFKPKDKAIFSNYAGILTGLQLEIDLEDLLGDGINLQPGTENYIGVTTATISRLESPYKSNCISDFPSFMKDQECLSSGIHYSLETCLDICSNRFHNLKCGCYPSLLGGGVGVPAYDPAKYQWCNTTNSKACLNKLNASLEGNDVMTLCFPCKSSCMIRKYSTFVSKSQWPNYKYGMSIAGESGIMYQNQTFSYTGHLLSMLQGLKENPENHRLAKAMMERLTNRFLKVMVYLKTLDVERITEFKEYSVFGILSAIGGAISLYLGISLIALFEIIESIFRLIFGFV